MATLKTALVELYKQVQKDGVLNLSSELDLNANSELLGEVYNNLDKDTTKRLQKVLDLIVDGKSVEEVALFWRNYGTGLRETEKFVLFLLKWLKLADRKINIFNKVWLSVAGKLLAFRLKITL